MITAQLSGSSFGRKHEAARQISFIILSICVAQKSTAVARCPHSNADSSGWGMGRVGWGGVRSTELLCGSRVNSRTREVQTSRVLLFCCVDCIVPPWLFPLDLFFVGRLFHLRSRQCPFSAALTPTLEVTSASPPPEGCYSAVGCLPKRAAAQELFTPSPWVLPDKH